MSSTPSAWDNFAAQDVVKNIEAELLELPRSDEAPQPVFILGAPRTGSTYLYQIVASNFHLPYFSNLTNDYFSSTPIVGLAIQRGVATEMIFSSQFGKTNGPFQPSEGSGPMRYWFGGGHPSQEVSNSILAGQEQHFIATLAACETLYYDAPLLIKNSWNCFRLPYLIRVLPEARFIWVKRDIRQASMSDLEARIITKGSPLAWNSATPSNLEQLRLRPATEQVVENQYEYNKAIAKSLARHPKIKWCELYFEDLVQEPAAVLDKLSTFLKRPIQKEPPAGKSLQIKSREIKSNDARLIETYVDQEYPRLSQFCYVEGLP